ncbi:flavin reductase family protein [Sphingobacterium lumbrici]|uniref:flavin reductase family protein n=1 Tax=Sphingobacterium lumbrici TaxID=2559600 RepID=UPI00112D3785|nr:flavin reductase family protein [Sphingobacterium lumbrici]
MNTTISFDPKKDQAIFDNLIKYAIAPRPICFASTIDKDGQVNLSPFSYFNLMSHQPPVCIFSPLRRMRDGSTKHTLENILEVEEVVINIVNYDIVQQQSLASTEYANGVNEFEKAGLTPIPSVYIKPPRVAESPIQLECRVQRVIPLSGLPGAGNLVLAEVLCMHVQEHLLNENNAIQQHELDLVARLGGDWYCRITKENLFIVPKPLRNLGIGVDNLPESIRLSKILTGNHLGLLANVEAIPPLDHNMTLDIAFDTEENMHVYVAQLLDQGEIQKAWQVLLKTI